MAGSYVHEASLFQLPTYADNAALPAVARSTPLLLSAGCAAIDRSCLQQRVCCCGSNVQQTDVRYIDSASHTARTVRPINIVYLIVSYLQRKLRFEPTAS